MTNKNNKSFNNKQPKRRLARPTTAEFQQQVMITLGEVQDRIEAHLATIPEHDDDKDCIEAEDITPDIEAAATAIDAITEEWILDPEVRKEFNPINWEED